MSRTVSRLLHRLRVRMATAEGGFTLPELLVVIAITGVIVVVLASSLVIGAKTTTAATTRLDESHDAQTATAYFVADVNNAGYFSQTVAPTGAICSTSGMSPVALFEWTEGTVTKDAFYGVNGSPSTLVRRYCESTGMNVELSLVKHLASTPVISCPTNAMPTCSTNPADVQVQVTETSGYSYTLRASPRVAGTGGPSTGVAVYVGAGGMLLGGNSTLGASSGVIDIAGGSNNCNGKKSDLTAPDGFYATSTGDCGPTIGTPPPDPWALVPAPDPSTLPVTNDSTTSIVNGCKTYQPGLYANSSTLHDGCLAAGIYYFDNQDTGKITLSNATSTGGVLIYVSRANSKNNADTLTLDNAQLSPMTSGPDPGLSVFLCSQTGARTCPAGNNTGTISITSTMIVSGVIYAGAGTLALQSNNATLTTGGIDVYSLNIQGNGSGVIVT